MKTSFAAVLLSLVATHGLAQSDKPIDEAPAGTRVVGYASVEAARAALTSKPGASVTVTQPDGWTIVSETSPEMTVWSFAPKGHYAYPAVVKRTVKEENGQARLAMAVSCEADKASCDRLVREFQQMNAKMAQDIGRRGQQP